MSDEIKPGYLQAKDLMKTDVVTFSTRTKVSDAIIVLAKHRVSGCPVVDFKKRVLGMFTEADILRYFSVHPKQNVNILHVPIIYSENIKTCKIDTPLYHIQKILLENGYRAIPVVDDDNILLGMISRRDLLKYIYVVNQKKDTGDKKI